MQAGRYPAAQGFRAVIGGALQGRRTSQPLAGSVITASKGHLRLRSVIHGCSIIVREPGRRTRRRYTFPVEIRK